LGVIPNLPQFEKAQPKKKNEKNPILKEEERIVNCLIELNSKGKITAGMFDRLKPTGRQPPRLYGLATVHKNDLPYARFCVL